MSKKALQYTLRNVPDAVDKALRKRARESGKSLNQVAVEALSVGAGASPQPRRDLEGIAGSLSPAEAKALEREIRRQRQVDEDLWR